MAAGGAITAASATRSSSPRPMRMLRVNLKQSADWGEVEEGGRFKPRSRRRNRRGRFLRPKSEAARPNVATSVGRDGQSRLLAGSFTPLANRKPQKNNRSYVKVDAAFSPISFLERSLIQTMDATDASPEPVSLQQPRRNLLLWGVGGIVLLIVAWAGWQAMLSRRLDQEKAFIESRGGHLYFADEITDEGDLIEGPVRRTWAAYFSREPLNVNLHKVQKVRECLEITAKYQGLWQIDLSESDFTDADAPLLAEMTGLRHLLIHDTAAGDAVLEAASKLPHLETLDLTRTRITPQGLAKWKPPATLKTLMLLECQMGDGALACLKDHPQLETLRLCDTAATTDHVGEIGSPPKLEELDLSGSKVDDRIAEMAMRWRQLRILRLADTPLTGTGSEQVAQAAVKFRELDLSGVPITAETMRFTSYARVLRVLSLSNCPMTDEMSAHLFIMRGLQELNVDGTKLTAEGIVRITEQTPVSTLRVSAGLLSEKEKAYIAENRPNLELIEVPQDEPESK